jgi:Putative metal-binding motif
MRDESNCCATFRALGLGFALVLAVLFGLPALTSHAFADDNEPAATCVDGDGDGFVDCTGGCTPGGSDSCGDCDDTHATVHPGAAEICDGLDNDCDGAVDTADSGFHDPDPVDNVDNDGDGSVDEGFGYCVFATSGPSDECKTGGHLACVWPPAGGPTTVDSRGTLTCLNNTNNVITWESESIGAGDCHDGIDNDCDGTTDVHDTACQSAEICDGVDNDGDDAVDEGFAVGTLCSVGQGVCQRSGIVTCQLDGSSACGATAGVAKKEKASFGLSCDDGLDNDCDGLTDAADPDCAGFGAPELCGNGIDDNGNGTIDEGYPQVGLPCSAGVGACTTIGSIVCTSDHLGVECGATAGAAPEAHEATCGDSIDNDCDGLTDGADPDCASTVADLGVTCSLPYTTGKPGDDCEGWQYVKFDATADGVTLKADLLALATDGSIAGIIENVKFNDQAHLASRLDPSAFRVATLLNPKGNKHTVYAPMPILRVTGTKGSNTDVAYCGILPYLDVTQPNNVSISLSETSKLTVSGFLPLVDVHTLSIQLDGVDILAKAGINPATAFPTGALLCAAPGSCKFQVDAGCGDSGKVDVEIQSLKVEGLATGTAREDVGLPNQVNTFSFTVSGIPPGGHIFYVTGSPLPLPKTLTAQCDKDDLKDTGTASAFGIEITSPTDQQVVASAPVLVTGKVCGGNQVSTLSINGKDVDVTPPAHQTCTPGNGTTIAPQCIAPINEPINQTDLHLALAGTSPGGTFHPGSNRVVAEAGDVAGIHTFNTGTIFALGPVSAPVTAFSSRAQVGIQGAVQQAFGNAMNGTLGTIDPAFVVGLKESAAQDFFNEKCGSAIDQFTSQMHANLSDRTFGTLDAEPGCSCDLHNVPIKLDSVDFTPSSASPTCKVDFTTGKIGVTVNLPDTRIQIGAHDSCTDHGLFGECLARTTIDMTAVIFIDALKFDFVITADNIQNKTKPPSDQQNFTWTVKDSDGDPLFSSVGTCTSGPNTGKSCFGDDSCKGGGTCSGGSSPGKDCSADRNCDGGTCAGVIAGTCTGAVKNTGDGAGQFDAVTHNGSGIECWGADICSVFQFIGAVLIEVFTLGFADGFDIVGVIDFDFNFESGFLDDLSADKPDPMDLDAAQIDPNKISSFGHSKLTPGDISVTISDDALRIAFPASFESQSVDPSQPTTPGATVTPASVPTIPQIVAATDEVSIMLADDVFNQVFSSMKTAGDIKAFCTSADALTVDKILPPDVGTTKGCDTLTIAPATGAALVDPLIQGVCHAIRGVDCNTLGSTPLKKAACVGFSGGDCTQFALQAIRDTCTGIIPLNIHSTDSIILCARQEMDPTMTFADDPATDNTVKTNLFLNDTNVVIAIDRGNDGYTGKLEDLKKCFSPEGKAAPDCLIYATCTDLTLKATMGIDNSQCAPGQTGFVFHIDDVVPSDTKKGVMCSASVATDDDIVKASAAASKTITAVKDSAQNFTPPFCAEGLTLGGILDFTSAGSKMFAITTDGTTGFADFLGLTCALGSPGP